VWANGLLDLDDEDEGVALRLSLSAPDTTDAQLVVTVLLEDNGDAADEECA
jgi:hypothetical protein